MNRFIQIPFLQGSHKKSLILNEPGGAGVAVAWCSRLAGALRALFFAFLCSPLLAHSQGLSRGTQIIETLTSDIALLVSSLAVLALIVLGICYALKLIALDSFLRYLIGCLIVGSAKPISAMFF